jgi:hypothetical protein
MSAATDLVKKVYQELVDRYGPSYLWEVRLPAGLRLELNPRLRHMLWTDYDLNDYGSFSLFFPPGNPEAQFRIPVKYEPELPSNSWRIVIVEELTRGVVEWEP